MDKELCWLFFPLLEFRYKDEKKVNFFHPYIGILDLTKLNADFLSVAHKILSDSMISTGRPSAKLGRTNARAFSR